jgi:hypothetical protein
MKGATSLNTREHIAGFAVHLSAVDHKAGADNATLLTGIDTTSERSSVGSAARGAGFPAHEIRFGHQIAEFTALAPHTLASSR